MKVEMKVDLHLHSTASDGTLTPRELVERAALERFDTLALTDHDSVEGIAEASETAAAYGVRLIAGAELSCGGQREIHVLGYGLDTRCEELLRFLGRLRAQREERAEKMAALLEQNGAPVSLARVRELARGVVARPHVARALVEAGHAASVAEAFERYLVPGKCAYVPKEDVKVAEAVSLIHRAGGAAVLAHPMELKLGMAALESLIGEWKAQGLDGIEVWHPSAAGNHAQALYALAAREGLLVTGGSDFHGPAVRESRIGEGVERWTTRETDLPALLARMGTYKTTR
ncbi:MAG: PHP domain-containing protein [Clostridia bacterium]|nr:PHP domain-containing protein [Clostridia bacterium]